MKKFKVKVRLKNGTEKESSVYLDDRTAELLLSTGDRQLIEEYLLEEYRSSRRDRTEMRRLRSSEYFSYNEMAYEDEYEFGWLDKFENENLIRAIRQLTPRQQEVVRLLFFEGMKQTEIAALLGIKKQAMSDVVHRIYKSLRKFMKKT